MFRFPTKHRWLNVYPQSVFDNDKWVSPLANCDYFMNPYRFLPHSGAVCALALLLPAMLQAEPRSIPIPNHSFEASAHLSEPPNWTQIPGESQGWVEVRSFGANQVDFTPSGAVGNNYLEISLGLGDQSNLPNPYESVYAHSISLGPIQEETEYTLTVAVHVQDEWHTRWRDAGIGFRAGDTIVAMDWYGTASRPETEGEMGMLPVTDVIVGDAFVDQSITLSTWDDPSLVGEALTIVLGQRGNGAWLRGVHFDNVRLIADGPEPVGPTEPPPAPQQLEAEAVSHQRISLSWQHVSGEETGFELERGEGAGGYELIHRPEASVLTYTDVGLTAETSYSYRIRAVNEVGASAWSNVATATTAEPPPPAKMALGSNFWNFGWGSGRADYFRNGIDDWNTVDNPWRPEFLDEVSIYRVLRFMDQVPINSSTARTWADRTLPGQNHYNTDRGAVAYEWQIDLCNRVGVDYWVNVPHLTVEDYEQNPDDNYWTRLAELVKEHLDPELNVYVEYSNETWSGGTSFQQGDYAGQRGIAMGFTQDSYHAKFYFQTYAALRLHHIFLSVFGEEAHRVKTVVAGQDGSTVGLNRILHGLGYPRTSPTSETINPWGYMPDYYAVGSYISTGDGAASDIRQAWAAEVANRKQSYEVQLNALADSGMRLIAYEGGQHYTTNAHTFSQNPESYDMYMEWLEVAEDYFDLMMHYTHTGTWSSGGSWGAKHSTDQPIELAHRYRALRDYAERYTGPIEPPPPPPPAPIWDIAQLPAEDASGWIDEWLGWVYHDPESYPWSFIEPIGWAYVAGESRDDVWLFVNGADWLYSTAGDYPLCYFNATQSWLYHYKGTDEFYDWASDARVTLSGLLK